MSPPLNTTTDAAPFLIRLVVSAATMVSPPVRLRNQGLGVGSRFNGVSSPVVNNNNNIALLSQSAMQCNSSICNDAMLAESAMQCNSSICSDTLFAQSAMQCNSSICNDAMLAESAMQCNSSNCNDDAHLIFEEVFSGFVRKDASGIRISSTKSILFFIVTIALAGAVSVFTIVGNVAVIIAIIVERRLRRNTNYFLLSLAVSDLYVGVAAIPLYTHYLLKGYWALGRVVCELWLVLDWAVCAAQQYTVYFITLDRYLSVTIPVRYRNWRSDNTVIGMVAIAWILPCCLYPPFILSHGDEVSDDAECDIPFVADPWFAFLAVVVDYWLFTLLMCFLYWKIYRVSRRLQKRKSEFKVKSREHSSRETSRDPSRDQLNINKSNSWRYVHGDRGSSSSYLVEKADVGNNWGAELKQSIEFEDNLGDQKRMECCCGDTAESTNVFYTQSSLRECSENDECCSGVERISTLMTCDDFRKVELLAGDPENRVSGCLVHSAPFTETVGHQASKFQNTDLTFSSPFTILKRLHDGIEQTKRSTTNCLGALASLNNIPDSPKIVGLTDDSAAKVSCSLSHLPINLSKTDSNSCFTAEGLQETPTTTFRHNVNTITEKTNVDNCYRNTDNDYKNNCNSSDNITKNKNNCHGSDNSTKNKNNCHGSDINLKGYSKAQSSVVTCSSGVDKSSYRSATFINPHGLLAANQPKIATDGSSTDPGAVHFLPSAAESKETLNTHEMSATSAVASTATASSSGTHSRDHKTLKTISVVLGAFIVCWTPVHILSLFPLFCGEDCVEPYLFQVAYWMCYLNSAINPFVYAYANKKFKYTIIQVLRCRVRCY